MTSDDKVDDVTAIFARSFSEYQEMGCKEAAEEVLRQGLHRHPSSALLQEIAEREGLKHLQDEVDLTAPGAMMEHLKRREILMQQMHLIQRRKREQQIAEWHARLQEPRPTPPPTLPEPQAPPSSSAPSMPVKFFDELEYPDKTKASRAIKAIAASAIFGAALSIAELCSATYFVWSFLCCHLFCMVLMRDYGGDYGILAVCTALALHAGHASAESVAWLVAADGEDSLGPWSIVVVFGCVHYLQSYIKECNTLPPDYISTLSFFFPIFPAYDAAVALNCLEFFLEWRYMPEYKFWSLSILLGVLFMAAGQMLVVKAARAADRNFWASSREEEEGELVGLEIPNRRVVQDGPYRWERHPAYLGALLWGIGAELILCNPVMLLLVGFVLWASLLHVTMEEEKELCDEFPCHYLNYCALTGSWIPGFNGLLEGAVFQQLMADNAPDDEADGKEEEEEEEGEDDLEGEEEEEEVLDEEDDLLPTWEGVPKGGAIWNRQFQDPWMLG
eukprot:TRINITY_DN3991_c1_g1_i1.p1 TRINITY_DN3991_c1_g1~~TRINITY_DN3991_c1_g1_i1.p1  ORF type:complete len:503 (+),score=119.62 TRINITY_DN3991_c1_g1_i1:104-1612(+)